MKIEDILKASKYDLERRSEHNIDLFSCAIKLNKFKGENFQVIIEQFVDDFFVASFNKLDKIIDIKFLKDFFDENPNEKFVINSYDDFREMKEEMFKITAKNLIFNNIHIIIKCAVALDLNAQEVKNADLKLIEEFAMNDDECFEPSSIIKKIKKEK